MPFLPRDLFVADVGRLARERIGVPAVEPVRQKLHAESRILGDVAQDGRRRSGRHL